MTSYIVAYIAGTEIQMVFDVPVEQTAEVIEQLLNDDTFEDDLLITVM